MGYDCQKNTVFFKLAFAVSLTNKWPMDMYSMYSEDWRSLQITMLKQWMFLHCVSSTGYPPIEVCLKVVVPPQL